MDIEFDPAKNVANLTKHRLPLSHGKRIIENTIGEFQDTRYEYGEDRYVAFGLVEGRLLVCVYTMRGGVARIISVRKASKGEVEEWLRLK